ncbi:MAG TPA: UDP-N-acetylmuramoyl-L-alanyl-D-glutamate--2,6-diaminopimelate ligase [Candidatus Saccharimonadales bacterium]|jgi:UDP-N-acetylmuramoyl-L-alanyl-D-glutamate--2,6-diaminopimelate ligase
MKDRLVKGVRRRLPGGAVRRIENVYRRGRIVGLSARYGFPARGMRVVAITGTNGKTTTANYLNEILKAAGHKTALFTTAVIEVAGNRQLNELNATVASTSRMQQFFRDAKAAAVDIVVLEITSHALMQHKLDGVPIECAIMTNLTQDHLDYHGTMEAYAAAKGRLFAKRPKFIVLNRDDEWYDFYAKFPAREQAITYGTSDDADARISHVKLYKKGSEARVVIDHQTRLDLATSLPGKFNVYNLTAAASAAYLLHVDLPAIAEGVANLEELAGRYERIEIDKPFDVIVDYAHTPDALQQLLEAVKGTTKQRVILVFGATGSRDKAKRPIMGALAAKLADRILLTDEESYDEDPAAIRAMVMDGIKQGRGEAKTEEIADRREAIAKALKIARRSDTILVTGMGHERFRIVAGKRLPWNDGDVIRELAGVPPIDKKA